jgi:arylsulfatase A-like enzyme
MSGYHTGHFPGDQLSNDTITVTTVLKKQGYDTGLIGKWGLDGNPKVPVAPSTGFPTKHGFDYFLGSSNQWICHNYYPAWQYHNNDNVTIPENVGASVKSCGSSDHEKCSWSGELWTIAAVEYIKNHSAGANRPPFFLYLAYTTPHAGSVGSIDENDIPVPFVSKSLYANTSWPQVEKDFATAVTALDTKVGVVMKAVKDAGIDDKTVVFFRQVYPRHKQRAPTRHSPHQARSTAPQFILDSFSHLQFRQRCSPRGWTPVPVLQFVRVP